MTSLRKLLYTVLCAVMVFSSVSCQSAVNDGESTVPVPSPADNTESAVESTEPETSPADDTASTVESTEPETSPADDTTAADESTAPVSSPADNVISTISSTDIWEAVPMVSQALLDAGYGGGEGCQWPIYITFDPVDGNLAFLGTDVGGMYRSTDGGQSWAPCTLGLEACAATGMAVDPNNTNRVLAVGCNSYAYDKNGLYLSTDAGETWSSVYPARVGGYRDYRQQIAFDKSSYDESVGGSKIVYWSREEHSFGAGNADIHPALYKSTDGGKTWKELPGSKDLGHSIISVHPAEGWVYCANSRGLFRSKDGGQSFEKIQSGNILGMDTILTEPDNIYIIKQDGLYISTDCGDSFDKVNESGFPTFNPNFIRVSPADPNRMLVQDNHLDKAGSYADASGCFYSHDGGKTWEKVDKVVGGTYRLPDGTWIPYCARQNPFAWHPTDPDVALTVGGDFVMRSTDGGKSFKWSNTGYNGMMTGGMINWNVNHPEWLFNPSQDYNGGYTLDGGKTWNYIPWYAEWGGWTYGGYVIDEDTVVAGLKDGMNSYGGGYDVHYLAVSYRGGRWVKVFKDKVLKGYEVAMGAKGDDNIVFMGEYRSADKGQTWDEMSGCDGVFTLDYNSGALFGFKGRKVVMSTDNGETWTEVGNIPDSNPMDIAYNYNTDELFVVANRNLYKRKLSDSGSFTRVDYGSWNIRSVCVDPVNPDVMYAACANNINQNEKSVMRSVDGGKTWVSLTRSVGDGREGPDGGREATTIRVNAATREVFVGTCCRGMWKMPAPQEN